MVIWMFSIIIFLVVCFGIDPVLFKKKMVEKPK
jgi:hypothetical protein